MARCEEDVMARSVRSEALAARGPAEQTDAKDAVPPSERPLFRA